MSCGNKKCNDDHGEGHCDVDEAATPANDVVLNKYISAGKLAEQAMTGIIPKIVTGASVQQLCADGDKLIEELAANFNKKDKKLKRGIAVPVCISVDNVMSHYAPLPSEPDTILKDGNVVKIDLAVHVDGFIGACAHTVVENKITGAKADIMMAAYEGMEAAIRMLHAGKFDSSEVSAMMKDLAAEYKVKPVENMLSHQIGQNLVDGDKYIVINPGDESKAKVEKHLFDKYEVYAVDIYMTTGEGKVKAHPVRTTVYRIDEENTYRTKMKASRAFLSEVSPKHGSLLFNLRDTGDETRAKMAVKECVEHGVLRGFPVYATEEGSFVAQFKCTVIIQPGGIVKTCSVPLDKDLVKSDFSIQDPAIKNILNSALKPKKKPAKKTGGAATMTVA
uniref:Peptidase_M24 domain-containing protein n=1 Tax=Steinernema glaseri TaxID=37863 RepID=A0A1I7ZCI2_9BILA